MVCGSVFLCVVMRCFGGFSKLCALFGVSRCTETNSSKFVTCQGFGRNIARSGRDLISNS